MLKKILQSAAFATLTLTGCTRTYTGQGYYDPETGIQRTDWQEKTLEEKVTPENTNDFEDVLKKHNYKIYSSFGESPQLIILADVHTLPVRMRNNALLKEFLTTNDELLIEGYLVGNTNTELEKEFFELTQQTPAEQKEIADAALANQYQKDTDKQYGYFNQKFPATINSCENDIFVAAHFKAKSLSDNTLRAHSIHYRNIAMAETLEKKINNQPETTFYQIIGNQHVIPLETFTQIGIQNPKKFDETSGELCTLLKKKDIPHIIIGPKDMKDEMIKGRDHPELKIDK